MPMKLPIIKHQSAEDLLSSLKADRVHAIVSDPPAGWGYQNREWDKHKGELLEGYLRDLQTEYGLNKRQARKLMLDWVPPVWVLWFRDIAKRMKRVLVPGGWVLIWTTPRMAHWTGMALEMAGFEIRDSIAWIYGQGMPKNANVSWLVDRELGYERGSQSPAITEQALRAAAVGTALCPGREDFILARRPLGTTQAKAWLDGERGALSIDSTRFSEDARWPKNTLLSPNLHEALGDKLRLFYCPKVKTGSRETEAGCENLTLSSAAEMTLRRPGTAGLKNGRAGRGRSSQGARNDHPCLAPSETVLTDTGYRPISSIKAGDLVYTAGGTFQPVEHVSSHEYTSPNLFKVSVQGTNKTCTASDNHPFLVWRPTRKRGAVTGGVVQWADAQDVLKGDYLMTPIPVMRGGTEHDSEDLWVFGYWLGNGCTHTSRGGRNRYPSFSVPTKKPEIIKRLREWGASLGVNVGVYPKADTACVQVVVFAPKMAKKFSSWSAQGALNKAFPAGMLKMSRKYREKLFEGYIAADGGPVRNYLQAKTVSPRLAAMLQLLGMSLGYKVNLFEYPPEEGSMIRGRQVVGKHPCWTLRFYTVGGDTYQTKPHHIRHEGVTYRLSYVKSVEEVPYDGDVWNLSVKNDPTFQTAVGMSHNTVKPIALARYLVRLVTQPGQIVCDPFSGSGSISIAAMMEGRRAVACDLEERYVEIGNARAKYWFDQGAPPPLYLRDPSGPEPAPRPGKDELLRVKVRTTQAMQDVIDRWPDPISPTVRAALDHYFGVIRDPGGPVIPAGYLEGFEDSRPTPGAPQSVDLFKDQAEAVAGASNPTIRTALRLWLGLAPHKQDDPKRVSRASLRIKG